MKYIISIDAGGTYAEASAYDEKGNKHSSVRVPCSNLAVDFGEGSRAILSAAEELIKCTSGTPIALCAGCAGVESGNRKTELKAILEKELNILIHVINDAELALFAAHGRGDGILIISGTGSIGYSRKDGELRRVGGWGHLIGDEGSGWRIAMDAISAITDAHDRKEDESTLKKEIFACLGISSMPELISFVYGATKRDIAALVPAVEKCAQAGNGTAQNILSRAGEQLAEMEKNRRVQRAQREKSGICRVTVTGYTNAGKSTLLNFLTKAGILAEDKLFATLDPTTRRFRLPSGNSVLLTDTVGFIRNLPHHFVKAFKSTLDEVKYADIIIMLMDASDSECVSQAEVTQELLNQLGAESKPILYVFNKCDEAEKADGGFVIPNINGAAAENVFCISAKTGKGVDALVEKIDALREEIGK